MLVTGYDAAGLVAVTNTEFDGETSWSATCNGDHYWTMLFYGADDHVTLWGGKKSVVAMMSRSRSSTAKGDERL
jgi:hypothetical protein